MDVELVDIAARGEGAELPVLVAGADGSANLVAGLPQLAVDLLVVPGLGGAVPQLAPSFDPALNLALGHAHPAEDLVHGAGRGRGGSG